MTGPIGLNKRLRTKSLALHRWNGGIYLYSIVINFIPGIFVSFFASGGLLSTVGFLILNTLWLLSTILGVYYIKKKNIQLHSIWMTRSFLLSLCKHDHIYYRCNNA
ncbi:DUF2306 domain-containing protein [Paenibacillus tarimensis]|uniref:DUF2306 domain-containing protein n=1 Tax=Paenibacillus tarimensis TaxID=416012 RepID=UPI001F3C2AB0|nr:DUF2306 domain-containing protein [Paenibacillus tarimensis]MCF2943277.1 DUF2306 domain-containing protein [Paenibacillus tarimensis]